MKGSTHALIGLAAASSFPIDSSITGPEKLLPFVFAYTGALICDIDTGTSKVSNMLNPIKQKYVITIVNVLFLLSCILGAIYLKDSKYMYLFISLMVLGGLNLNNISSKVFSIVKKVAIIAISVGLVLSGVIYTQPPVILIGLFLLAMVFSPHRGYSHSLVAVVVAFFILKYAFSFYNLFDYSLYFCIGMLSHILADMFTQRGVPLLFPIQKKYSFPITFKTGSSFEIVFCGLSIVIISINVIIK
ncbi:UNVERIFIED_CONTAM: inner membrane protein [Acetivibrio alkalicellulosi]